MSSPTHSRARSRSAPLLAALAGLLVVAGATLALAHDQPQQRTHEVVSGIDGAVLISSQQPTSTSSFDDVAGSVHRDAIDHLTGSGVIHGYEDGMFRPHRPLSRGQLATIMARLLELDPEGCTEVCDGFVDIDSSVHGDNVRAVAAAGIVSGYRAGTYRPEEEVTRAQAASIVARALELAAVDRDHPFVDTGGSVHEPGIAAVYEAGLVQGRSSTRFEPGEPVSRGQIATILASAADHAELNVGESDRDDGSEQRGPDDGSLPDDTTDAGNEGPGGVEDPGPAGDFSWAGFNWERRSWGGAPHFNGQYDPSNVIGPDGTGRVTLRLTNPTGMAPKAAEFRSTRRGFGYGTYSVVVEKALDRLQPEVVWGCLFTYDPESPPGYNEIDLCEASAWGGGGSEQWPVEQGHGYWFDAARPPGEGNVVRSFEVTSHAVLSHRMNWEPGSLTFETYAGDGFDGTLLRRTVLSGATVPVPANEAIHFNLWVIAGNGGNPDQVSPEAVVVRDLEFAPSN